MLKREWVTVGVWPRCRVSTIARPAAAITASLPRIHVENCEVLLFRLQGLEQALRKGVYASLPGDVQLRFRQSVVMFVLTRPEAVAADAAYVKNKIALVIGLLIQVDYPERWPSAFDDMLGSFTSSPVCVDLFLRVLTVLDEEVVQATVNSSSDQHAHFTMFKDTMRSSGAINRVADFWFGVIHTYSSGPSVNMELVELCLTTMNLYVSWIDISLAVNDRVIPKLLEFLGNPALREASCECFLQIVSKGMDDAAKVQLIASLRIVDVLSALKLDFESEDDIGKPRRCFSCVCGHQRH